MAVCKGCGKRIEWGVTVEGKKIPLDPVPHTYERFGTGSIVESTALVTHFATCSHANEFSGGKKRETSGLLKLRIGDIHDA